MSDDDFFNEIIIARCCRDWPIHRYYAYNTRGRCGICRSVPEIVNELYPESEYARNKVGSDSSMDRATDF